MFVSNTNQSYAFSSVHTHAAIVLVKLLTSKLPKPLCGVCFCGGCLCASEKQSDKRVSDNTGIRTSAHVCLNVYSHVLVRMHALERACVSQRVVCWLLIVPATCKRISGTDLLRQFYVHHRETKRERIICENVCRVHACKSDITAALNGPQQINLYPLCPQPHPSIITFLSEHLTSHTPDRN